MQDGRANCAEYTEVLLYILANQLKLNKLFYGIGFIPNELPPTIKMVFVFHANVYCGICLLHNIINKQDIRFTRIMNSLAVTAMDQLLGMTKVWVLVFVASTARKCTSQLALAL